MDGRWNPATTRSHITQNLKAQDLAGKSNEANMTENEKLAYFLRNVNICISVPLRPNVMHVLVFLPLVVSFYKKTDYQTL